MADLNIRARDALARLHKAGKIKSPWLAGMAFGGPGWSDVGRIVDVGPDGNPSLWEYRDYLRGRTDGCEWYDYGDESPSPLLENPATLGCILALAREAWGDPAVTTASSHGRWYVCRQNPPFGDTLTTEAEALVAALEAACPK